MNIRLIKKLDSVIGYISASIFPSPVVAELSKPIRSLLVIRPGGIGDAVLLIPSIVALQVKYPGARITVLAERRNGAILALCPKIKVILHYDRPRELLSAIRGTYDAVIDTEQSHRLSAVVARIASAPTKIGYNTNERRRMFTHAIPYSHDDYEAVSFTHLLGPLGINSGVVESAAPFLSIPDDVSDAAGVLLASLKGQPYMTLFPGASISERRWGAERFRGVADKLSALGIKVVVVGGKDDRRQGELIAGGGCGLNLAGLTSLPETAAIILKSSLLLSGDSGVLHIAVGLGVPTVSLFGPGRAKKWAPREGRHIVINKGLPCSPCTTFGTTPPCPINSKCMQEISIDEVITAVTTLLTSVGVLPDNGSKPSD